MAKISRFLIMFAILWVVAACQNQQAQEDLPTLASLPTETPSMTPSDTPIPSDTPTVTPSLTPTITLSPTTTPSPTPTLTFTPSLTFTATTTQTSTLTFTPTQTPTSTATNTPEKTATPTLPVIQFFQSNVTQAAPGSNVTLRWSVSADTVELRQITPGTGTIIQTFNVGQTGSQVVTLPSSGSQALYRLVGFRGGQQTSADIPITFTCSINWFFSVAPPGGGCPTAQAISVVGASQVFERGIMIMYTDNNQQRVCGLQNEGNQYLCYANGWDGSTEVNFSCSGSLTDPDNMFNWAFDKTLASGGTWQQKLGCGTATINNTPVTTQFDQSTRLYIQTPYGLYYLNGNNVSGTWQKIA